MSLILDAGALIALERGDRVMWRRLKSAHLDARLPVCHGGIVGQVWRGRGARQALLAKALRGIDIRPLDEALGRAAGALLVAAKHDDVVDAALVAMAAADDVIVTSDPDDLEPLAVASGRHLEILPA